MGCPSSPSVLASAGSEGAQLSSLIGSFLQKAGFLAAITFVSGNIEAQVTTCGRAEGGTSYTVSNACTPSLTFSVSGRCLNACGAETMAFSSETVTAFGFCQLGLTLCRPSFQHFSAYNATSREFFSDAFDREGGWSCNNGPYRKAARSCPCVGCGNSTGPDNNTGTGDDPLLVSLHDTRYELTSRAQGVFFDLDADGSPELTAWTRAGGDEAFLVLDRNFNGRVDNGHEIFGDETPQLPSENPNGFRALAVFDEIQNGGNADGKIDQGDSIYTALQLWIDFDHDGQSSSAELQSLASFVSAIHLDYQSSESRDELGHEFRYWSSIERSDASNGAIIAVNVFFANRRAGTD